MIHHKKISQEIKNFSPLKQCSGIKQENAAHTMENVEPVILLSSHDFA